MLPSGFNADWMNGCPVCFLDNRPEGGRLKHSLRWFVGPFAFVTIALAWAEDRALLGSNLSAVPRAGTKAGSGNGPLLPFPDFRPGTSASNPGGLGAKPPDNLIALPCSQRPQSGIETQYRAGPFF